MRKQRWQKWHAARWLIRHPYQGFRHRWRNFLVDNMGNQKVMMKVLGRMQVGVHQIPNGYMRAREMSAGGQKRYLAKCRLLRRYGGRGRGRVHPFCSSGFPLRNRRWKDGGRSVNCY